MGYKIFCKICIITIHKGDLKFLKRTIASIDRQSLLPAKHIIVAKNINNFQMQFCKKNYRFVYLNNKKDKSIYDAMNFAKNRTENLPIFFLNSGDILNDRNSLYRVAKFEKLLNLNYTLIFQTLLRVKNTYFQIKKFFFKDKGYLPHSTFLSPNNFFYKKINFNIKHKISADGYWMRNVIKKSRAVKKIDENIVVQNLYGLSSFPTGASIVWRFDENMLTGIKEVIKFILSKLIKKTLYFKFIHFRRYNHFKSRKYF